jgi:NADPH:quinone reductase
MRAAVITRPGGPDVLEIRQVPVPFPRQNEVLVRVRASALNRADLLQRMGRYPAPHGVAADIPGLELAGDVVEAGPGAEPWTAGDRVFGIVAGGGNAEFAVVPAGELARIPDGMSWEDAAAVPEAFITAHDALSSQAGLKRGEWVLVHAAGSGVGLAAIQLAAACGAHTVGTARTAEKLDRARALGLDHGEVIRDPASIPDAVRRHAGAAGVNVALELVGGDYLPHTMEAMADRGRVVLVGLMGGRSATLNLGTVLTRRLQLRGTVLRTRPAAEKAAATRAFAAEVVPLLEKKVVRPVVDRVFPLSRIVEAHALLESNATFGKVVLLISD